MSRKLEQTTGQTRLDKNLLPQGLYVARVLSNNGKSQPKKFFIR
jgi:hypothetical protein